LPRGFDIWADYPRMDSVKLWYCATCHHISGIALGSVWCNVKVVSGSNIGTDQFYLDTSMCFPVKPEDRILVKSDPTKPPYPGATICPQCHIFREQILDGSGTPWHKCSNCGTGEPMLHLKDIVSIPDSTNRIKTTTPMDMV